jgi:hypothetical protein
MHDLDPVFRAFTSDPRLVTVARDLGLSEAQMWQSMYIFKQPGIGGEVRWHQDATYFDTTPVSVTTFWFALEDATLRKRLHVGRAGRPSRSIARAIPAQRRAHVRMKNSATCHGPTTAAPCRSNARPAARMLPRPAAALQRAEHARPSRATPTRCT